MISRIGHLGYNIGQLRLLRLTARNRNYYDTLGISRDATEAEIKKAYKDLARKYHPDRPDGNNEIFLRVQEANETLSSALKRAEYDRETFGETAADTATDEQSGPEMGAFVGKKKGGTYYSPEYVDSLRKWDEWKERFEETVHRLRMASLYTKQNPFKVFGFLFGSSCFIYGFFYYLEEYLETTCSKFYYDKHERATTVPMSKEWHRKREYIEKEIVNKIPENPDDQINLYGSARIGWLKDFYKVATMADKRGVDEVDLRDAVRFLPFVGKAFLEKKIPLDPSMDFDDSFECKMCELIYGKIFKFYPEEFLEEYPNRASFFIREFLPNKNFQEAITPEKMLNPDYVDPFTGKKNDAFGFQEWKDNYVGSARENQKHGYENTKLLEHFSAARGDRNLSKMGSRATWER